MFIVKGADEHEEDIYFLTSKKKSIPAKFYNRNAEKDSQEFKGKDFTVKVT